MFGGVCAVNQTIHFTIDDYVFMNDEYYLAVASAYENDEHYHTLYRFVDCMMKFECRKCRIFVNFEEF